MKHRLADAIFELIGSETSPKLKLGLVFQTRPDVAEQVARTGHAALVVGDRFGLLYRAYRRVRKVTASKTAVLEAKLESLPIKNRSLDALVVLGRVPAETAVKTELPRYRNLLKANGLLLWPHPMLDGVFSRAAAALWPFGRGIFSRIGRHELCAMAMESGFKDIGQVVVPDRFIPWVVTTARAAPRPFEKNSD